MIIISFKPSVFLFCVSACRAPVSVAGPACGLVFPAQIWLSDLSVDGIRDQQTRAGPESQWCSTSGHRSWGRWAEGVQGRRVFQRMLVAFTKFIKIIFLSCVFVLSHTKMKNMFSFYKLLWQIRCETHGFIEKLRLYLKNYLHTTSLISEFFCKF